MTTLASKLRPTFQAQSRPFYVLLGLTLLLLAFGLAMVGSASAVGSFKASASASETFFRQLSFAAVGLAGLVAAASMPLGFYRRIAGTALFVTLAAQLYTVFFGQSIGGNTNWINVFGYSVQPSEFLKLSLILSIPLLLAKIGESQTPEPRLWFNMSLLGAFAILLVAVGGNDLGTGLVMAMVLGGMLLLGGMPWGYWLGLMSAGVAGVALLISISASRRSRISAWLNPTEADRLGVQWQFEHGTWALAAGGWFGTGLGRSKLKWSWIPEVHNDFIFAVIGEEMGLIGAGFLILLFFALGLTLFTIARRQNDVFGRNIVIGVMLWLPLQAFVNIGVVLGWLPVLGVTLPFVSAGGSSLIANLVAVGLVLAVERHRVKNPLGGSQ
jgi:cell division protein FtsW